MLCGVEEPQEGEREIRQRSLRDGETKSKQQDIGHSLLLNSYTHSSLMRLEYRLIVVDRWNYMCCVHPGDMTETPNEWSSHQKWPYAESTSKNLVVMMRCSYSVILTQVI